MPPSWLTPIDAYCERIDAAFWSEPFNAITNGAFIVAAVWAFALWRRAGGTDKASLWLIAVTTAVGIGSFLFHTFANRWSVLFDVIPITIFIYSYFLVAMRRYLGLGWVMAALAAGLFIVFNALFVRLWLGLLPGLTLNGSVGYLPAALALVAVGTVCLSMQNRAAGRALVLAAGVFALSLVFRSIDSAACSVMPIGTHFLWHVLNAVVLLILTRAAIASSAPDRAKANR
jgi:hypothetical protein